MNMNSNQSTAKERLIEEQLYKQISDEKKNGYRRDGLWLKAISESNNDENKAEALYVKLRLQSIVDEEIVRVEQERMEREAKAEQERMERKAKAEQERMERKAKAEQEIMKRRAKAEQERMEREAKAEQERMKPEAKAKAKAKAKEEKIKRDNGLAVILGFLIILFVLLFL